MIENYQAFFSENKTHTTSQHQFFAPFFLFGESEAWVSHVRMCLSAAIGWCKNDICERQTENSFIRRRLIPVLLNGRLTVSCRYVQSFSLKRPSSCLRWDHTCREKLKKQNASSAAPDRAQHHLLLITMLRRERLSLSNCSSFMVLYW